MLINSAAHFAVCACGGHGKLVTATGQESIQFCSKEKARQALDDAVGKGIIADYEVGEALRQINTSSLAEQDKDANLIAHITTDILNTSDAMWMDQTEELPHLKYKN
jgi:hypothetical protein